MPVYNLGQFGQPAPSPINGLSDAIAQGLHAGAEKAENKVKKQDIESKNTYYKLQNDQLENKKKQESLERSEHIATQLTTMDPGKRAQFLLTPAGQEQIKDIKKYVPWAFDDHDNFIGVSNEKVVDVTRKAVDNQLENMKLNLSQKLQNGETLSRQEQQLATMFKMGNDDVIKQINNASLLEASSGNNGKGDFSEENLKVLNQKYGRLYNEQRKATQPTNQYANALGSNPLPPQAPPVTPAQQGVSTNQATSQKKSFQSLWS